MTREQYLSSIRRRIGKAPEGTVFTASDFTDIAPQGVVKMALSRLVQENRIRRVMRGVYDKPEYSKLLNEYAAPQIDKVARAIGKNNGWTVIPYGEAAANLLGLSTQVPAKWIFATDGPYKEYQCGTAEIRFKHVANKDITGLSFKSALLIQALKALGSTGLNEQVIRHLSSNLTPKEKQMILKETKGATAWVAGTIREICA
ncbi:MAG: type IV toxin-antitoxin system AbiEi family antitoxin domain-containing protein [Clostridia bacterium]|nr:type IV toxin-antitoxin system AbiEi family antitoxin domain-containing protein [Clostridia bacterium]